MRFYIGLKIYWIILAIVLVYKCSLKRKSLENSTELISNLGRISFFLILLLAVFLLTVKSSSRKSNYLLAAMLLVMAFDFSGFFMWDYISNRPLLVNFKMASSLLQMPLFYFYVMSVCYSDLKFKIIHILHIVPFILFVFLFEVAAFSDLIVKVYEVLGELQWLFYMSAIFITLKRHREIYRENYSRSDSKIFKWIFQFAILSTVGHAFVFAKSWFSFSWEVYGNQFNLDILIGLFVLIIITWFTLKALLAPELFTGIKSSLRPIRLELKDKNTVHQDSREFKEQLEQLQSHMEKEKPYLDFELSLEKLAQQLNMPEKELSLLINHHLGKHFFDFVNTYRIKQAKSILANPEFANMTILEVLYQVGFNSKSSFYTAFKKVVGKTPIQYRNDISLSKHC